MRNSDNMASTKDTKGALNKAIETFNDLAAIQPCYMVARFIESDLSRVEVQADIERVEHHSPNYRGSKLLLRNAEVTHVVSVQVRVEYSDAHIEKYDKFKRGKEIILRYYDKLYDVLVTNKDGIPVLHTKITH